MFDVPTRVGLAHAMSLVLESLWSGSPKMRNIARSLSRSHERILATDAIRSNSGGSPFTTYAIAQACQASLSLCCKIDAMMRNETGATDEELCLLEDRLKFAVKYAQHLDFALKMTR